MGNKEKNIFDALCSGIDQVKNFWDECKAQDEYFRAIRLEKLREEAKANIRQVNLKNYHSFANALGRYLVSNYEENGLKKPHGLEDIIFKNIEDQITVNIGENAVFCNGFASVFSLDFHFEVSRKPFDGTLKDIMENKPPEVSNEEIEMNMDIDLGKYTEQRGFTFSQVIVDDALRRRVKITVKDVHWTEEGIMQKLGRGL